MNILLLLCGALSSVDLPLPMRLSAGEALAFAATPVLLLNRWPRLPVGRLWLSMITIGLFVAGVVVSDLVNGTSLVNYLRGIAKPVFVTLHAAFFVAVLMRNPVSLSWYFYGRIPAALLNYFFPSAYTAEFILGTDYTSVAFGVAPVVSLTGSALAVWLYLRTPLYSALALIATGLGLVAIGAPRSNVLTAVFPAVVILLLIGGRIAGRRRGQRSLLWIGFFAATAVFGLYRLYTFTASRGMLSGVQIERYEEQVGQSSQGQSFIGLLASGRTEVYAAILAIKDRPFLGYGSWSGNEMADYFYTAVAMVSADGGSLSRRTQYGGAGTAGHSVFFTGWLENGILAAIALLGFALVTARVFWLAIAEDSPHLMIVLLATVTLGWDWLFSPFNMADRIFFGLTFAFYLCEVRGPNSFEPRLELVRPFARRRQIVVRVSGSRPEAVGPEGRRV